MTILYYKVVSNSDKNMPPKCFNEKLGLVKNSPIVLLVEIPPI